MIERDFDEQLSAYIDGALGDEERRAIEERLARDDAARARLAELREVIAAVRSLPRASAPPGLARDIMDQVRRTPRPVRGPAFRSFLAGVGLAAAAVFVAFAISVVLPPLGRHKTPEDRTFALTESEEVPERSTFGQMRAETKAGPESEVPSNLPQTGLAVHMVADEMSKAPPAAAPTPEVGLARKVELIDALGARAKDAPAFTFDTRDAAQGPAVDVERLREEDQSVKEGVAPSISNGLCDSGTGPQKGAAAVAAARAPSATEHPPREALGRGWDRSVDSRLGESKKEDAVAAATQRIAQVLRTQGYRELAALLVPVAADDKSAMKIVRASKPAGGAGGTAADEARVSYVRAKALPPPDASAFSNVIFVETPPASGAEEARISFLTNADDLGTNRKRLSAKGDVYVYYRTPAGAFAPLPEPDAARRRGREEAEPIEQAASKPAEARAAGEALAEHAPAVNNLVVIVPRVTKE